MARPTLYEDSVALSLRIPRVLRDRLRADADEVGTSLNAHVVTRLSGKSSEPAAPIKAGAFEEAAAKLDIAIVGAQRMRDPNRTKASVMDVTPTGGSSTEGVGVTPSARIYPTDVPRPGMELAIDECTHPKGSWQSLSYMTRCGLCGAKVR